MDGSKYIAEAILEQIERELDRIQHTIDGREAQDLEAAVTSPAQLVHAAMGYPRVDGATELTFAPERCWVCGGACSRAFPRGKWVGSNFTSHAQCCAPHSEWVCEACAYVCSRTSPVPGRPAGKCQVCLGTMRVVKAAASGKGRGAKVGDDCPKCGGTGEAASGGNFRNYSHLFEEGWTPPPCGEDTSPTRGYLNASKGEKPLIRDFLLRPKQGTWFAAIADSAQKHVLPWAPLNAPGVRGLVLMDEALVSIPDNPRPLVDDIMELLTAGVTKDEVLSGNYTPRAFQLAQEMVIAFEAGHGAGKRGSEWFALAVWLSQRDEEQVAVRVEAEKQARADKAARKGKDGKGRTAKRGAEAPREAAHGNGGGDPHHEARVPRERRERDEELGGAPKPDPRGNADDGKRGGVGQRASEELADPKSAQLGFAGFG